MEDKFNQAAEILFKEDRIQTILKLRKIKLNQKLFQARQRQLNIDSFKTQKQEKIQGIDESTNKNKKNVILKFNEEEYFIDPDDININQNLEHLNFVETNDIIVNITELLNNINDLNSILYGVLMMRKFTVIDSILINKSDEFIKNKLYSQICNVLNTYYNNNKKIVFECLWILSRLVYDSQDKEMFYFLLNEKCLELYKKIILFYCEKEYDTNIIKVISIFILNMLIFKQKESENENNIINCDVNDEYLLNFLNGLVDLILNIDIAEEIYISLFIEITNCFYLDVLLKNDLLNKIIIFLINESINKLEKKISYYDEEIYEYYEDCSLNSKMKINTIYQIILIQLQYFLTHPLKEMPFNSFKKLSEEIINQTEIINEDKRHLQYYIEYINSYIYYLVELNLPLSFIETKKIFDFLIYFLKNTTKNKTIIVTCIESLNNLSTKMSLNKMIGFLIEEIPYLLTFIKTENNINLKIVNEIFDLLITILTKLNLKIHRTLQTQIFEDVLFCLKFLYDCDINNDIKQLFKKGYTIISKIIEINEKDEIKANYKSVLEEKGIKDIINNLINMDINIGIPIFLLNFLKVGL